MGAISVARLVGLTERCEGAGQSVGAMNAKQLAEWKAEMAQSTLAEAAPPSPLVAVQAAFQKGVCHVVDAAATVAQSVSRLLRAAGGHGEGGQCAYESPGE
eukprot:2125532-Pyramimonas_sp.AAC.1